MNKLEANQLITETKKWIHRETNGNVNNKIILGAFKVGQSEGQAFAIPVSFDVLTKNADWTGSKANRDVAARIRAIQAKMDEHLCPWRTSVYLTHEDGICFLLLGTDQVDVVRRSKALTGCLPNVTLSFENASEGSNGSVPCFKKGQLLEISASSPIKGRLYLYSIDANRIITPVYPPEGRSSLIKIAENSKRNLNEEINERIEEESIYDDEDPLKFCGNAKGHERLVAVVLARPVPMTIAHLKSRLPLPKLYSYEQQHKGVGKGRTNSSSDFSSLSLEQIAIGTLDYYYEG